MSDDTTGIRNARRVLENAGALLITAGAGMGVDSGLPDFRGNEGFWQAYPAFASLGLSFAQLANPQWFDRDPALAWGFYGHRLHLYRTTQPHAGFAVLRRWGGRMAGGCFVFTSNVDGQFQAAGFDAARVVECHGSIHHLQCSRPCADEIWDAAGMEVTVDPHTMRAAEPLPRCPHCGAIARPNVLMFGDGRWLSHRTEEQHARYAAWLGGVSGLRLAIVECGAGSAVPTVRLHSERVASATGGTLIRVNPRQPEAPLGPHVSLAMPTVEAMNRIGMPN